MPGPGASFTTVTAGVWPLTSGSLTTKPTSRNSVCISDVTANVPAVPDDETNQRLSQLAGQRVLPLGKDGLRKFNVNFRADPVPSKVPGLARFSVQVVSREHGPVGLVRTKAVWTSNRPDATVSFTNLNKVDWEEGWHFIRVLRTE